jgi:hypothetical protein
MEAVLSPLAFFVLIAAHCAAVVAVNAMNEADEPRRERRADASLQHE